MLIIVEDVSLASHSILFANDFAWFTETCLVFFFSEFGCHHFLSDEWPQQVFITAWITRSGRSAKGGHLCICLQSIRSGPDVDGCFCLLLVEEVLLILKS